jgi:hypothetical protein
VTIGHFGDGAARHTPLATTAVLSVGDVSLQTLDWIDFVRNDGPHDIRITLDRAPPRQLARGETAPASGRFRHRTTLSRIECRPERSAALPRGLDTATAWLQARAGTRGANEHRRLRTTSAVTASTATPTSEE